MNPTALHDLKLSKDAEEWLKTVSPGLFQNYDQIQTLWNAPATQFAITLMNDGEFRTAAEQIQNSHLSGQLLGYEFVLLLVLWVFRAWRLSKVSTFFTRMWTQAWIAALYWVVALFVVPGFVWGEAYRTVLSHLAKAVFRHFIA